MRTGLLRNKVVVTQYTAASDGAGGQTGSGATLLTAWGQLNPLSSDVILRYGMTIEQQAYELIMLWAFSTTLDSKDTLTVDSENYRIKSVMPISNMKNGLKLIVIKVK